MPTIGRPSTKFELGRHSMEHKRLKSLLYSISGSIDYYTVTKDIQINRKQLTRAMIIDGNNIRMKKRTKKKRNKISKLIKPPSLDDWNQLSAW